MLASSPLAAAPAATAVPGRAFYLPSLDGLRACAALLVFFSHAGWGHLIPGGFGVTVFFFLSGYLITTLLRREVEQHGRISFRSFYLRRVYRIFPPMYLLLFLLLGLCLAGVLQNDMSWGGVAALLTQSTNYYLLSVEHSGLLPFTGTYWSLAIEEHFYLLFPALFAACAARWPHRRTAALLALVCVAVLAWRCVLIYWLQAADERTYLATDTRLDSLLFGCVMGLWRNPALDARPLAPRPWQHALLLGGAIALLLGCFVVRDPAFRATWRYTLQGLALFPVFWYAVRHPQWPLFRPLNWRAVRWVGEISYVFYLSHLLWLAVAWHLWPDNRAGGAALALGLTLVFSWAVHLVVERPFARLRKQLHH
ncbi:acyltransferase family protein [Duganella sp. S19_KUP01_CR8]|uniref:acyltransferase family protein n=1 Tax=Duganella sp. S19_KUP01_CR8 TaxID=3025502 RepID=UPI002FCDB0D6